ncbi:MAG: Asp-tRNA(Asn)/Glu-tRNA(Gln) amidotransferase subunit GatC [Waddliaceae bacterium]
MSQLKREDIHYLAQLCRIRCTEEEEASLAKDLEDIRGYVKKLDEVDTENIPPCHHVLENFVNVMREDKAGETLPREAFLSNAPSHIGGMIRVPPVIKGKT